jgi:hypothetical protein
VITSCFRLLALFEQYGGTGLLDLGVGDHYQAVGCGLLASAASWAAFNAPLHFYEQ